MIGIRRRPEPAALTRAGARQLAIAMQRYQVHGAPSKELSDALTGYDADKVKQTLFEDQRKKCAWCERRRDFSSSPIEHYRPRDGAWRHLPGEAKRVSDGHYWWLTWTWGNLLFACARCNDRGHKANYFPLVPGTSEAQVPARPASAGPAPLPDISVEQPLLLDPSIDDFLDHVRWEPANTGHARRLWTWSPRALSPRGQATIDILKLGELADELEQHLRDVLRCVEEVEQHMRGRRVHQAAASWNHVLAFLAPDRSFTAATWCALSRWVDDATLTAWKLPAPTRPR